MVLRDSASPSMWEKSEKKEESISNPREDHRRLHREQEGRRQPAKAGQKILGVNPAWSVLPQLHP